MSRITSDDGEGERVVQNVLNNIIRVKELTASKNTDKELLQALVGNPIVQSLAKAHTGITEKKIKPAVLEASELSTSICNLLDDSTGDLCVELSRILSTPHIVALLGCHDSVAKRSNLTPGKSDAKTSNGSKSLHTKITEETPVRAVRMVGMYKKSWEPLGITVVKEDKQLKIARILQGSEIDKKGLLHIDDIILEVNGNAIKGDPKILKDYLIKATGSIVFKILPSYEENQAPKLLYLKCHIDYDPEKDKLTPCHEAGLGFARGEILQVVDQTDADWWQARRVNNKGEPRGRAGLIPSQSLEEKRRSMQEINSILPEDRRRSKKRRSTRRMYSVSQNSAFDKHDIAVYEEVACIPPISRKTIVILMQSMSAAETIARRIADLEPEVYGIADNAATLSRMSTLSRSKDGGEELNGEQGDTSTGKELLTAREIIGSGKICIIIASPQTLKIVRTSEFLPYAVYVKADSAHMESFGKNYELSSKDIERYYMQYVDSVVDFSNWDDVAKTIIEQMKSLETRHQWVPTSWVY